VLQRLVALAEHLVETLGLRDRAREAVKDEADSEQGNVSTLAVPLLDGWWLCAGHGTLPALALLVVVQLLLDHANDNVIAD
jgi:hypothetical protein